MKHAAYGIDFGTTNSLVAVWGEDILKTSIGEAPTPYVFYEEGNRPHPSIVWVDVQGNVVVGWEARRNMTTDEHAFRGDFIKSIKRRLGKGMEIALSDGSKKEGWEVAAEIFRHLRNEAQKKHAVTELTEAVVTVPVQFDGRGRRDIRLAMAEAGIRAESFVHEPFAALISEFYDQENKLSSLRNQRVVVFDWGGGTLDLCVAKLSDDGSKIYELAHDGISDRAGDEFDANLKRALERKFAEKYDLGPGFRCEEHLSNIFLAECERAKIQLSNKSNVRVLYPHFHFVDGEPEDLVEEIERQDFEALIQPELDAAKNCVYRLLEKARLLPESVDKVLMVGGTSSIPAVRTMLEKIFGAKVNLAKKPDAAIAQGAAIVAAERWRLYNVNDICIKLSDDSYFPILKAGEPLTAQSSKKYFFHCIDSSLGEANLFFHERKVKGDDEFVTIDSHLQVPTKCEDMRFRNLDRIEASFSVTKDATLSCRAVSSSVGEEVQCEIHQLTTGLIIE